MKQIVLVMITLFLSVSASYAQTADETDKNSANTIVTSRTKENSIKEWNSYRDVRSQYPEIVKINMQIFNARKEDEPVEWLFRKKVEFLKSVDAENME